MDALTKNPALALGLVNSVGGVWLGIWSKNQFQDLSSKIEKGDEKVKALEKNLGMFGQIHQSEKQAVKDGFAKIQADNKKLVRRLVAADARAEKLAHSLSQLIEALRKANVELPKGLGKKLIRKDDSDSDSDSKTKRKKGRKGKEESESESESDSEEDKKEEEEDDRSKKVIEDVRRRRGKR